MSARGAHPPGSSRPPARHEPPNPDFERRGDTPHFGSAPVGDVALSVPFGIRLAGAWGWRLIVVAVVLFGMVTALARLSEIVIPFAIAILLSALLTPVKRGLRARGVPRALAVLVPFLGLLIAVAALITLVVISVHSGINNFQQHAIATYKNALSALSHSAFAISQADVNAAVASAEKTLRANSGKLAASAFTGADFLLHFLIALLLTLFITLFFLIDGPGIWRWCVRLAPRRGRSAIDGGGKAAWFSLHEYVRIQVVVAFIDGVAIGVIAAILRVPFAVPLGVLVFLGAFIPIIGSITTGLIAVLVALAYNSPINALIMLIGLVAVNQLETHVLHPLLLGSAVRLHPIAVVLAVAGGTVLGGIAGALFAVPTLAATNSAVKYIAGGQWKEVPPPPTDSVPEEGNPSPRRDDDPTPGDVITTA
jgi:predicted PurR-regulated permease PerM